jgi:cyclopropane-fatty-acyl-phospholipid synthase
MVYEKVLQESKELRTMECPICGEKVERLLFFEKLPVTDTIQEKFCPQEYPGSDLHFYYCELCDHGFLHETVTAAQIYSQKYKYRTSESISGTAYAARCLEFLKEHMEEAQIKKVLEIGSNDLFFLKLLKQQWSHVECYAIDPMLPDSGMVMDGIYCYKNFIEDKEIMNLLAQQKFDLIICRHTLEHISNPRTFFASLENFTTQDTLCLFEIPDFEHIIFRARFDHIYHQHVNYFTEYSFLYLLKLFNFLCIDLKKYHDYYGTTIIFFKKSEKRREIILQKQKHITRQEILSSYSIFSTWMSCIRKLLEIEKGDGHDIYGYGASQILPILVYHIKVDVSILSAIFDDDRRKDGLTYANLPVTILHGKKARNLKPHAIVLTATDASREILPTVLSLAPVRLFTVFPSI